MVAVADSVVEREDGDVVVPLIGSVVGLGGEREAVGSVSGGWALEVVVPEVSVQAVLAQAHYDLVS